MPRNTDAAIAEVRRAIKDEGIAPGYHRRVMDRHRHEWPVLWEALDRLISECGPGPHQQCEQPQQGERVQGVVFICQRGRMVLMERCPKKAARHGGEWFIPGGRIEAGETEEQALIREVGEELGLSVHGYEPLPLVDAGMASDNPGSFLMRPFILTASVGEFPDHCLDHPEVPLRWVPLEEARRSPVRAVRAIIAALSTPHQGEEDWSREVEDIARDYERYMNDASPSTAPSPSWSDVGILLSHYGHWRLSGGPHQGEAEHG